MFDAIFFCTAKHTNVIHYKDIWMKKIEHKIDENNTTKHGIDTTTLNVYMLCISNVMIEFIDWN